MSLHERFCRALFKLVWSLAAEGSTTSYNSSGTNSPFGSREPGSSASYDAEQHALAGEVASWRQKWDLCLDDAGRLRVVEGLEARVYPGNRPAVELKPETEAELFARIVRDGAGWSTKDTALSLRVSETMVRKARIADGRNPGNGLPLKPVVRREERAGRAHELRAEGLSIRQIAMILKVSVGAVHGWLQI